MSMNNYHCVLVSDDSNQPYQLLTQSMLVRYLSERLEEYGLDYLGTMATATLEELGLSDTQYASASLIHCYFYSSSNHIFSAI